MPSTMARRGEACFYRCFLRHHTVCGGLFSQFIHALIYAVFLGLITLTHRGLLIYLYHKFLERYGEDVVPRIFIESIPACVTPAYCILMTLALFFILCPCCGRRCQTKQLVNWTLAMLIGSTALSLLSYSAQVILFTVRVITMFLDKKVLLFAVCYCAPVISPMTNTSSYTTHEVMTSSISDHGRSLSTTAFLPTMDTYSVIVAESTELATRTVFAQEEQSSDISSSGEGSSFWCLCDVPFGEYPLGVSTNDPSAIDAKYLSRFMSLEYYGDVVTYTVNSTEEVLENADTNFTDEIIMLLVLQGMTVVLAFRIPLWLMLADIWSHLLMLDILEEWHITRSDAEVGFLQPRQTIGRHLWEIIGRADSYIKSDIKKDKKEQSSRDRENTPRKTYEDGFIEAIRKRHYLPELGQSVRPALVLLFHCLLLLADTFFLCNEFFYRRHYFKSNMTFTYVVLTSVGVAMLVVTVLNTLTLFPREKTSTALLTVRFLCVLLTCVPYLFVRVWLLVEHNCFIGTPSQMNFFALLIVEALLLIFGAADLSMELRHKRDGNDGQPGNSSEEWRGYCYELAKDAQGPSSPASSRSSSSSSSSAPSSSLHDHINLGADFGETSDVTDSVFISRSSYGETQLYGDENMTFVRERQTRRQGTSCHGNVFTTNYTSTDLCRKENCVSGDCDQRGPAEGAIPSREPSHTNYETSHETKADGGISLIKPWYKRFSANNYQNRTNKEKRSSQSRMPTLPGLRLLNDPRNEHTTNSGSVPAHYSYSEDELSNMALYI